MCSRLLGCLLGAALAAMPAAARAQAPEYSAGVGRYLSGGGEFMAVAAPRDETAFFNYSSYRRNLVRIGRLRLFGEWRPADRLSLIGELRTENVDDVTAPALYLRWRPSASRELFIHAGRIPPVIGGFSRHAYGRDNLVIGQPLAYQYLTSLRPDALPGTADNLIRMRARGWLTSFPIGEPTATPGVPLVSVAGWDTGASAVWRRGRMDLSAALTRGAPAVPVVRETNHGLMWSGRAAARLPGGLSIGVSGARGQWLTDGVLDLTPAGRRGSAAQSIVGTDLEVGAGPWLVRGEWLRSVFELPIGLGGQQDTRLTAWSGFVEARYRPVPRWQFGVRLDRLAFGSMPEPGPTALARSWDADVDRVEAVVGFRATRRLELRGGWQHNWRDGGRVRERGLPVLAGLYWF